LEACLYVVAVRWATRGGRELTLGGSRAPLATLAAGSEAVPLLGDETDLSVPLLAEQPAVDPLLAGGAAAAPAPGEPPLWQFLRSRSRWRVLLSLLVPNLLTTLLYVIQFLVVSLLAATYGKVAIAAHNSALALFGTLHALGDGMASATAVRIGHFLGAGDGAAARRAAGVALAGGAATSGAVSMLGFALRRYLGRIFSDDAAVGAAIESLASVFCLFFFASCSGGVVLSVLDAQGRPNATLAAFLGGGYGVGLPLAVAAWWHGFDGIRGLWTSLLIGNGVQLALAAALLWRSDWSALAAEAQAQQQAEEDEAAAEREDEAVE